MHIGRAGFGTIGALLSAGAMAAVGPCVPSAAAASPAWQIVRRLSLAHVTALAVAPGGRTAAVLQAEPSAVDWIDLPGGKVARRVPLPAVPRYAAFSGDGRTLVVTYAHCAFGPGPCADATTATVLATGAAAMRTVAIGSGAGALSPVGTGPDVLVAASGSGTVALLDTASHTVVQTFQVGSGVLSRLAVDPTRNLAAVANVTAGTVTFLDLADGQVGAVGDIAYEIGGLAFLTGMPYLFAGQAQGQVIDIVHTSDGSRPSASAAVDGVGTLVYLPKAGVLAAGALDTQTVAILHVHATPKTLPWQMVTGHSQVPIGPAATGTITGLASLADGSALRASARHGLAVLSGPSFAVSQRFLPAALGGTPTRIATADGGAALVAAGAHVDVIESASLKGAARP